jgi:excinuclease ABC subunit A
LEARAEIASESVVSTEYLSVNEATIAPWANSQTEYHGSALQGLAEKYGIDLDAPWRKLPEENTVLVLFGASGERLCVSCRDRYRRGRQDTSQWDGTIGVLEKRYAQSDFQYRRKKIAEPSGEGPVSRATVSGGATRSWRPKS